MADNCPECGQETIDVKTVDARPGGALFKTHVHEKERLGAFNEITESCTEVVEWGEESDHASD